MDDLVERSVTASHLPHDTGGCPLSTRRSRVYCEPSRSLSEGSEFGKGESMLHGLPARQRGRREV